MAEYVQTTMRDSIALITLDRPPSNVLTPEVRKALAAVLEEAITDSDVIGIVLTGAGQGFSPGVDLGEYNGPLADPSVLDLGRRIENSPKPVVAALHGAAMAAGFELALAAHARVAQADTRIAMPDVKLGMIPGAGATQRLPRVLGAQKALEILLSGQMMRASDPRLSRLMTQLTQAPPVETALKLAKDLAASGRWKRSCDDITGFTDPEGFQTVLSSVRAQMPDQDGAAGDILSCIETAQLLPFEQGLAFEQALFTDRLSSPDARGSRHFLMAEKFAAQPPRGVSGKSTSIRHVALIGGASRMGELALMLLRVGYAVTLICAETSEADTFGAWATRRLQDNSKRGQLSDADMQKQLALLEYGTVVAPLAKADLVIDDASIVLAEFPELREQTIWSVLEPGGKAADRGQALGLGKPPIGMHPYHPMASRHVVELSISARHRPDDIAALAKVMARTQKSTILTTAQAGALRAALGASFYAAAVELVRHGAQPYAVDAAAREAGFSAGPFELMDRAGLPQVHDRLVRFAKDRALPVLPGPILERFIKAGRSGRSAGQGFFNYVSEQREEDSKIAHFLPPPTRRKLAQKLDAQLLQSALIGVLANEATRLIADKQIRRASDIDLILVKGFGFNRALGGPLLRVDMRGLFYLYKDMQGLCDLSPLWSPTDKMVDMVKEGTGFFGRSVG